MRKIQMQTTDSKDPSVAQLAMPARRVQLLLSLVSSGVTSAREKSSPETVGNAKSMRNKKLDRYPSHVEERPGLQLLQGALQLQIWQGTLHVCARDVCAQRRILDAPLFWQ